MESELFTLPEHVQVVGLSGKAASGKDHMAKLLQREFGLWPIGFGDMLKINAVARGLGSFKEVYHTRPQAVRTAMQLYGTEHCRVKYGEHYWTKMLGAALTMMYERWDLAFFVIPDVRFKTEVLWIQHNDGLIIRLRSDRRPDVPFTPAQDSHQSETDLDGMKFAHTVNNGVAYEEGAEQYVKLFVKAFLDAKTRIGTPEETVRDAG